MKRGMKYLREARLEEGSDWFWAIARAHMFVNQQIKSGNHYAAVIIESSLVEYALKFLLLLHVISRDVDMDDDAENKRIDKDSEEVYDENFARNIDRAARTGVVSRRLGSSLHRFRKARNELVHDAFFFGIKVRTARGFVSKGNRIMNELGRKIDRLMEQF